jgi:hypothetical protein
LGLETAGPRERGVAVVVGVVAAIGVGGGGVTDGVANGVGVAGEVSATADCVTEGAVIDGDAGGVAVAVKVSLKVGITVASLGSAVATGDV